MTIERSHANTLARHQRKDFGPIDTGMPLTWGETEDAKGWMAEATTEGGNNPRWKWGGSVTRV
jgi:hypothetical protein